jgi:hypothetical protein
VSPHCPAKVETHKSLRFQYLNLNFYYLFYYLDISIKVERNKNIALSICYFLYNFEIHCYMVFGDPFTLSAQLGKYIG